MIFPAPRVAPEETDSPPVLASGFFSGAMEKHMTESAVFTLPQLDEIRISKVGPWVTIVQETNDGESAQLFIHEFYVDRLIGALKSAQNG